MERSSEAEAEHLTSAEYQRRHGRLPAIIGVHSGGCFHVLDPRVEEVRLGDIAHHLAFIGRYTGACSHLWSVGAHCLVVADRILSAGGTATEALQGLLHDASEAYLVDIPRPFKPDVSIAGETYYVVEERVQAAIHQALSVPYPAAPIVKTTDDGMVHDEVANFFPPGFMWERYSINRAKNNLHAMALLRPETIAAAYVDRFETLYELAGRGV